MGVTDTARNRSDQDHTFDDLRLTEWTSCGGCAAKWGAALLKDLVADFPASNDPSLLIGLAPFDDAAVYRVSDDIAIVSTTDFFPPLVDHPSDFGAIAAANACSDVFAMGGRVVMAINVAAFPEHFPREAIAAIFEAAAAVVAEAGGSVAGGHTIRNPEPIFGLAVQGVVHPDRVFRKGGARARRRARAVEADRHRPRARPRVPPPTRRPRSPACANSTAPRRRPCNRSATPCTPSPTSPDTGSPDTDGRWPSAATCG